MLLPNPTSGFPSRYVIQNGKLYEMQVAAAEGIRSWFVGETIQSDGSLYMITPLDPIFMFIPILEIVRQQTSGSAGRFMVVDDIFENDQYTSLRHLTQLHSVEKLLAQICEVRDGSLKTFRMDDERVMAWLKKKTITQSSLKLVCAYLSEDWATRLSATYSFPQLDALESRTQVSSVLDFGKRSGMDFDEDPKAKEVKKPKMSVGQRKLAKASTAGMKPLSSFFAKKA
ncbi:Ribonuclease H2 subunit B [Podila verticillata]|nr:Ribonuclease H2 subunit B [Podila verticillata]